LLDLIKWLGLVSKNGGQTLAFVRRFLLYYAARVFVAVGLFLDRATVTFGFIFIMQRAYLFIVCSFKDSFQ
jgi:hypothetical protein